MQTTDQPWRSLVSMCSAAKTKPCSCETRVTVYFPGSVQWLMSAPARRPETESVTKQSPCACSQFTVSSTTSGRSRKKTASLMWATRYCSPDGDSRTSPKRTFLGKEAKWRSDALVTISPVGSQRLIQLNALYTIFVRASIIVFPVPVPGFKHYTVRIVSRI